VSDQIIRRATAEECREERTTRNARGSRTVREFRTGVNHPLRRVVA
jgi:hypothetical protein